MSDPPKFPDSSFDQKHSILYGLDDVSDISDIDEDAQSLAPSMSSEPATKVGSPTDDWHDNESPKSRVSSVGSITELMNDVSVTPKKEKLQVEQQQENEVFIRYNELVEEQKKKDEAIAMKENAVTLERERAIKQQITEKVNSYEERVIELELVIDSLNQHICMLNEDVSVEERERALMNEQNQALQHKLKEKNDHIKHLENRLSELNERFIVQEQEVVSLENSIDDKTKCIKRFELQVIDLKKELDKKQEEITLLQQKWKTNEQRCTTEAKSSNDRLKEMTRHYEAQITSMKVEFQRRLEERERSVMEMKGQISRLEQELEARQQVFSEQESRTRQELEATIHKLSCPGGTVGKPTVSGMMGMGHRYTFEQEDRHDQKSHICVEKRKNEDYKLRMVIKKCFADLKLDFTESKNYLAYEGKRLVPVIKKDAITGQFIIVTDVDNKTKQRFYYFYNLDDRSIYEMELGKKNEIEWSLKNICKSDIFNGTLPVFNVIKSWNK